MPFVDEYGRELPSLGDLYVGRQPLIGQVRVPPLQMQQLLQSDSDPLPLGQMTVGNAMQQLINNPTYQEAVGSKKARNWSELTRRAGLRGALPLVERGELSVPAVNRARRTEY